MCEYVIDVMITYRSMVFFQLTEISPNLYIMSVNGCSFLIVFLCVITKISSRVAPGKYEVALEM